MRFKKEKDGEWVQPKMRGYLMKCCDCGLVHKIDFRVLRMTSRKPGGYKVGRRATGHYVQFRAFRVKGT